MDKLQILIADDNEMNRLLISEMLKGEYEIIEAENGKVAVSIMQQNSSIDILLLDINMPELDGIEVLKIMNDKGWIYNIPVIIISSETDSKFIRKAYDLGAEDFINRPFNVDIVSRRIKNAIMLHSKQKKLINEVSNQFFIREKQSDMLIHILSSIVECRNGESGEHVRHISIITGLILEELLKQTDKYKISQDDINAIRSASSFHDIGKMEIPGEILNKPGRLTFEEFEIMKTHSEKGYIMIDKLEAYKDEPLLKYAKEICRWHHERYDGRGYPDKLCGDEIPISAQVVSIADVYDALTAERCYKKAFTHDKAIEMINNNECGVFNPIILDCLNNVSEKLNVLIHGYNQISQNQDDKIVNAVLKSINKNDLSISGNIKLLKEDKEKYDIFNEFTNEMWIEYYEDPSLLVLNKVASKHLNMPCRIENPANSNLSSDVFDAKDIKTLLQTIHRTKDSNEFDVILKSKNIRLTGKSIWQLDNNGESKLSVVIARLQELGSLKEEYAL